MDKIKVIAVVGPTASGKTGLAVELAKEYGGEVVSADSMQVYKHMDIATAKPTKEEMQGIPHHLIDFLEPDEKFSVAKYVSLAHGVISDIYARGKLPIVCGGTGLFCDSLLNNIQFTPTGEDLEYRNELRERAQKYGAQSLLDELAQYDPESAERLHPNNLGRIIRAMECYKLSGVTITEQNALSRTGENPYESLYIGINYHDREVLYSRINKRVDLMMQSGLLDEAKNYLSKEKYPTACAAIGYKEFIPYFDGEISLEQAIENLKRSTRRYAKRQLTWFRRNENINWIFGDEKTSLLTLAKEVAQPFVRRSL